MRDIVNIITAGSLREKSDLDEKLAYNFCEYYYLFISYKTV